MREKKLSFGLRFYFSINFDSLATVAGKIVMVVGRSWRRRQYVAGLSRKFKPRANGLASLGLLSCSAIVGVTLQLLACLECVHHSGGLQLRATHEIQLWVPVSLHNLEQFFTLSHTLPLHDSHLNTGLLIAKIQANLARNKANKIVDKIQPYTSISGPKKVRNSNSETLIF